MSVEAAGETGSAPSEGEPPEVEGDKPEDARREIVIGLVGALGTDLAAVEDALKNALLRVSYSMKSVRVSALIDVAFQTGGLTLTSSPETKLDELMDKGDALREKAVHGGVTAALAISAISNERHDELDDRPELERAATATVVRQLKHPDEVRVLRSVYGPRFVLIGAWAPKAERERATRRRLEQSRPGMDDHWYAQHVSRLLERDEKDGLRKLGQRVRDTFELADAYVALCPGVPIATTVDRIVGLLFGSPFETPTRQEQAMYLAFGARLRSSASGRQVGAVVVDDEGEVLVSGTNEVPKAHGGQYWTGESPDFRDFRYGIDYNDHQKMLIFLDVIRRLQEAPGWLVQARAEGDAESLAREAMDEGGPLAESRVSDILEFGRILHAEMAAICTAARRGTAIGGQTMYTTTYPCHQCARLIVGSGIRRLVYVDPYPKSQVPDMYRDEVAEGPSTDAGKVIFQPFEGVAPRLYESVFLMGRRDRNSVTGEYVPWSPENAAPRLISAAEAIYPLQYMEDHITKRLQGWLGG